MGHGEIKYFRNMSEGALAYTEIPGSANPWNGKSVGSQPAPYCGVDVDGVSSLSEPQPKPKLLMYPFTPSML